MTETGHSIVNLGEGISVVVLAAGESVRFDAPYPKQQIVVDGETLMARVLRHWKEHKPVVVTRNAEVLGGSSALTLYPRDNCCTAASLLSSRQLWGERGVLVLFSDVFYPDKDVERIAVLARLAANTGKLMFFTDGQDLFGGCIPAGEYGTVERRLEEMVANRQSEDGNFGRIWELYRAYYGIEEWPMTFPKHGLAFFGAPMQDFDTIEDLNDFREGKTKNILGECP